MTLKEYIFKYSKKNASNIEIVTYEECEYFFGCTKKEYNEAVNDVRGYILKVRYYENFIELSGDDTLRKLNLSEDALRDFETNFENEYSRRVWKAFDKFNDLTGISAYQLGRSGRHICVEKNLGNAMRYDELREVLLKLEQEVIDYFNYYKSAPEENNSNGNYFTVKDLIEKLSEFPKDSQVLLDTYSEPLMSPVTNVTTTKGVNNSKIVVIS